MPTDPLAQVKTVHDAKTMIDDVVQANERFLARASSLINANPHGLTADETKAAFGLRLATIAGAHAKISEAIEALKTVS